MGGATRPPVVGPRPGHPARAHDPPVRSPAVLATLPSWLDQDRLRALVMVAVVVLLLLALWIVRFVQVMAIKTTLLVIVLGLGIALWVQRSNLGDCATKCSCRLFGTDVRISNDAARTACDAARQRTGG